MINFKSIMTMTLKTMKRKIQPSKLWKKPKRKKIYWRIIKINLTLPICHLQNGKKLIKLSSLSESAMSTVRFKQEYNNAKIWLELSVTTNFINCSHKEKSTLCKNLRIKLTKKECCS